MNVLIAEKEWFLVHAKQMENNSWQCKKTGDTMQIRIVNSEVLARLDHILEDRGTTPIAHLLCPTCQPDWKPPGDERVIFKDELTVLYKTVSSTLKVKEETEVAWLVEFKNKSEWIPKGLCELISQEIVSGPVEHSVIEVEIPEWLLKEIEK